MLFGAMSRWEGQGNRIAHLAKDIASDLAEIAWPTRCVVCDMPGELLCDECRNNLPWVEQRFACPICGSPHGWLTCTGCGADAIHEGVGTDIPAHDSQWECRATICSLEFKGPAALMATAFKDRHELRLAPIMAALMATALDEASSWSATDGASRFDPAKIDAICFVPATAAAFARRGYDHMELVARCLSQICGLPLADVLVRVSVKDQRSLGKEGRQENLRGTIRSIEGVCDMRFLLLDDIITTGASIREATRALLLRGADSVVACSMARGW